MNEITKKDIERLTFVNLTNFVLDPKFCANYFSPNPQLNLEEYLNK